MDYRRIYSKDGCYFFTVVTNQRKRLLTTPENIARLRAAFRHVKKERPFNIDAIVVLPDHLHCLWHLPDGETDFSTRWRLIKHYFSQGYVETGVNINRSMNEKGEKGIWQRRFWEHFIRNEEDWRRHIDYIHFNPVKHGYVSAPKDWEHSSFLRSVERGWYPRNWGHQEPGTIEGMNLE